MRHEKENKTTKKELDPAAIHSRRNAILHKKGIRELSDPGRGA